MMSWIVWLILTPPAVETRIIQEKYNQTSNISRTVVGNKLFIGSGVVGASPVGAAPTTFSFSTKQLA